MPGRRRCVLLQHGPECQDVYFYNTDLNAKKKATFKSFTDMLSILPETVNREKPQVQAPPFLGPVFGMRGHSFATLTKVEVD